MKTNFELRKQLAIRWYRCCPHLHAARKQHGPGHFRPTPRLRNKSSSLAAVRLIILQG